MLARKWWCSELTSAGQGAFPMAILHAAVLFWQEENAAVWPSAMLYQWALRLINCPCLLFIGFYYLFQLQILLWSNNRFWKKECLKGTHETFMALFLLKKSYDYCKLEWFTAYKDLCPLASDLPSLFFPSLSCFPVKPASKTEVTLAAVGISRDELQQGKPVANDTAKAPSFDPSQT